MFKNIMSVVDTELNDFITGNDIISINESDNLLSETQYENNGFFVIRILEDENYVILKNRITSFIQKRIEEITGTKISNFSLDKYHTFIKNDEEHYKIANWEMDVNVLAEFEEIIRSVLSATIRKKLQLKKIIINDKLQEIIGFRIVRPSKGDENPFHRDSWMKQWENTLNVWIPIAGCNSENSLTVIEDSHFWNDSRICRTKEGVVYNKKKFRVAAAISTDYEVRLQIPNPSYGEALVFSPYLIHGNAKNNINDTTRVSIELRYERAD
jgi:ectoine hydroxylase-related dioxygenase (phytanoyl-CoA dioxygenase family)